MTENQDPLAHIAHILETKSAIKQQTFRNLGKIFKNLKAEAQDVVDKLNRKIANTKDKDVKVKLIDHGKHEFHVKLAGDLIVFLLHTNIVTLNSEHGFYKSDYVQEEHMRKYLGQLNVYNFMADSVEYNRMNDPGYLIARLFVNFENRFLVEGQGQLGFMFEQVSNNEISKTDLNIFIKILLAQTIDTDLITAPFPTIRQITLDEKIRKTQALGGGYKIGFQMNYQKDQEAKS